MLSSYLFPVFYTVSAVLLIIMAQRTLGEGSIGFALAFGGEAVFAMALAANSFKEAVTETVECTTTRRAP